MFVLSLKLTHMGSATWNSTLTITKGIYLIGGDGGTTVITGGSGYLISYSPSDYSPNYAFRLSGFTFDANGDRILGLGSPPQPSVPFTLQTKVRIDHNIFKNSGSDTKGQAIWNYGTLYGVVDNNTFDGINYAIANSFWVGGDEWWDNSPQNIFEHGSSYYLYYEDNTFINMTGYSGGADNTIANGEYSARYVFRYNTVINDAPTYDLLEIHGQQGEGPESMAACFGAEAYGNQMINGANTMCFWKQRSGQSLVFFNNAITSSNAYNMAYTSSICTCPVNHTSLKVTHNSYWFNSRKNFTGELFNTYATGGLDCNDLEDIPTLGRDIFSDNSSPGVGCGSTLPATCIPNQGYWLTCQSCNDLTGMVGKDPATPIEGSLYICTTPNTWTEYYTPYTYPHPLRGESTVDLKIFLEGPFIGYEMETNLNIQSLIPNNHPFSGYPWNYAGTESVASIPNADIVDWVLVELRDTTEAQYAAGSTMIAQQAAFLLNDGSVVGID